MILPRSEIPEWFINQSSGSEITLQLPQHCCQNLIGFALCGILETSAWTGDGFHVGCEYSFEIVGPSDQTRNPTDAITKYNQSKNPGKTETTTRYFRARKEP